MKGHGTFSKLYNKLNIEQKRAVDAIEGPVMVIAGPGTGKTQILTLRIANILRKTDTTPDNILALTFTESGVFSMRKRLVEMIGSDGYRVGIYTFHGFCNEVIKQHPDAFPRIIGASNINDVDKIALLKNAIQNSKLKRLRPFGDNFFYVNPIRSKISELKRENISPKDLKEIIKAQKNEYKAIEDLIYTSGKYKGQVRGKYRDIEKQIAKNEELFVVYGAYEKLLEENRLYDYEDMIVEATKALEENSDLLLELQEQYQYLLADEHQDANNAQNRLLELLASFHENPNLFIVGDEKQAIFRFQGASIDNFLYFKDRYPKAVLVTLEQNYRSTQFILDSAHSLIGHGPVPDKKLRTKLKAQGAHEGVPIELYSFSKPDFEHLYLAEDIQSKLEEGVEPQEIVVLYRNNRDAEQITRILEKTSVPFVVESDQSVLGDTDIKKLIAILKAIHHFGGTTYLVSLLHIDFFNIEPLDIYRVTSYAQKERMKIYDVLRSDAHLKKAQVSNEKQLSALYTRLSTWAKSAHNMPLLDFFDVVINESGFLSHILDSEYAIEKLEKLNGLFDDVKALVENHRDYTLTELITYFNELEEHGITVRKESKNIISSSVRLMTAHKSKGLEFDYVYITDAYDTHWGNKKTIEHFKIPLSKVDLATLDKNDDERRLFYVALTRARLGASVLFSNASGEGKPRLPSQFVEEIDERFVKKCSTEDFEKGADTNILLKPSRKVAVPPLQDKTFLNELFIEQGLSVTALNNYLACPWNYFYSNLLRVPKSLNKHLMFGSAAHYTLNDFFNRLKDGEDIGVKKLIDLFEDNLKRQPLSEHDFMEAQKKGEVALEGYYKKYIKEWNQNILNEFKVSVLLPIDLPECNRLKLRGDLDKIEFLGSTGVNVVDYKTGKPKTRSFIEGSTKTSNGNYKRQLVFYKLLLDLFENGKYKMQTGEIDFIEPDEKGKYHKEMFDIVPSELEELKETITKTTKEILDLSFWDTHCDDKKCEYCKLREGMGA